MRLFASYIPLKGEKRNMFKLNIKRRSLVAGIILVFLLQSLLVLSPAQATVHSDIAINTAYNMITSGLYPNLLILTLDSYARDNLDATYNWWGTKKIFKSPMPLTNSCVKKLVQTCFYSNRHFFNQKVVTMAKPVLIAFLIALTISGLANVENLILGATQSGTNVTGIITSDTTWNKTNSPYTLTGPVAVNSEAVLTIEPGVMVNLGNYYLQVNGTLVAKGTSNNQIIFNKGTIEFTSVSNGWNEQTGTGSIIENAVLSSGLYINNSPKIHNDIFNLYGITIVGGSPLISNNTITHGGIVLDGNFGTVTISDNSISDISNMAGISIDNGNSGAIVIERNLITKVQGIYVGSKATIQNNTITNNTIGLGLGSDAKIIYNNIQNNSQNNIYMTTSTDVDVANNYWGTINESAINQSIYDFKNNYNLGNVKFVPFLTAPNPQAMPNSTPTPPTPSSTPTTTSSILPTHTVTPTQTLSPSLTPTSSIPEASNMDALNDVCDRTCNISYFH